MIGPDNSLIAEFNGRRSEAAFAALVRQHIDMVFATAFRQVGDAGAAEEITQNVFVTLAQRAGELKSHPTIGGWLHQTALNKSREWLRAELRRRKREQVAVSLQTARGEGGSVWAPLVPLLDEALLELREADRQAVILHFLEGRTFQEVGSSLGVGEDAARKRVDRCLDQLTNFFRRQGFAAPALAAGTPLFVLSAHTAPPGLAASATAAALSPHSTASTLTLIKGALKIMAWTKAKTAIVAATIVLLAAGTTTVTVKEIREHSDSRWEIGKVDSSILRTAPRIVKIVPSKFPKLGGWASVGDKHGDQRIIGLGVSADDLMSAAFGVGQTRTLYLATLPKHKKYDFISNLPAGSGEALQREVEKQFGVTAQRRTIETNVLLMELKTPNAPGLRPTDSQSSSANYSENQFTCVDSRVRSIANLAEGRFGIPVIDQTGLTGNYDMDLKWENDSQHENLKRAIRDELGLDLVPGTAPVEMLVVEKAR